MKQKKEEDDEPWTKVKKLVEISLNDPEVTWEVLVGALLSGEERKDVMPSSPAWQTKLENVVLVFKL